MNPNYTQYRFPEVKPLEWRTVFDGVQHKDKPVPAEGIDIVSNFLKFNPLERIKPFEALSHPFFDQIRVLDFKYAFVGFFFWLVRVFVCWLDFQTDLN